MQRNLVTGREVTFSKLYSLVAWIPTRVGVYLRGIVIQLGVGVAGAKLRFDTGIRITGWDNISLGKNIAMMRLGALHAHDGQLRIGNNVSINTNSCIAASDGGRIEIEDDVLIAQNVVIRAADHRHDDTNRPIIQQGHSGGDIFIGEGAWIGANAVITKNVRIGAHAIVGAGAVVTRDVAPFTIAGGVPARWIRDRVPFG
jgi:galactoside O-acetyltransferase